MPAPPPPPAPFPPALAPSPSNTERKEGSTDASNGLLPWVGVSSHGLLALLSRWAFAVPRLGGLGSPANRLACSELLLALMDLVKPESGSLSIDISISSEWRIKWPRPPDQGRLLALQIDADGHTNIQRFVDEAKAKFPAKAGQWWHERHLERFLQELHSYSIYDIFKSAAANKQFHILHKQLVWALGYHLEVLFRGSVGKGGMTIREPDFEQVLDSAPLMDRKLVQYVLAGRRTAEALKLRSFSLCTDKASVGGLGGGLQNTIFVLGASNIALFGIPQVTGVAATHMCNGFPPRLSKHTCLPIVRAWGARTL